MHTRFKHAITVDDRHLDELMHGLIQDVEGGYVHRLAFVIPEGMGWPLPMYELALMTAGRAFDMNIELSVTIATPEDAPLAVFGLGARRAIRQLLDDNRVTTITSAHCEIPEVGRITIHPGSRELLADRIVAMPELVGPTIRGIPGGATGGFIPIDARSKVRGVERIYAAGDATDFAIKHGGIAAQQADVAAQAIGALAGAVRGPAAIASGHPRDVDDRRQAAVPHRADHRRPRFQLDDHRRAARWDRRARSRRGTSRRTSKNATVWP